MEFTKENQVERPQYVYPTIYAFPMPTSPLHILLFAPIVQLSILFCIPAHSFTLVRSICHPLVTRITKEPSCSFNKADIESDYFFVSMHLTSKKIVFARLRVYRGALVQQCLDKEKEEAKQIKILFQCNPYKVSINLVFFGQFRDFEIKLAESIVVILHLVSLSGILPFPSFR